MSNLILVILFFSILMTLIVMGMLIIIYNKLKSAEKRVDRAEFITNNNLMVLEQILDELDTEVSNLHSNLNDLKIEISTMNQGINL